MGKIYSEFAKIYDKLILDIDYKEWADFAEKVFDSNNIKPKLILDLGCGTGNFCTEMAKRGYEMIGVDISCDMLSRAKSKADASGLDILYLNQDMTKFELFGTVDAIFCLLDSVNYVTSKNDLKRMFHLANNYLNPDGLFVFDINSENKISKTLGNNLFYEISDDLAYIWQNSYDAKKKIGKFDLTFFIKQEEKYERYDEQHFERAYSEKEIDEILDLSGFKIINKYDSLKLTKLDKNPERIFFICKKL